jgi:hypothetical protein
MKFNTTRANTHPLSRIICGTKFFLIASVLLLAACKKESNVGLDVQPEGDLINVVTTDTMMLVTYTVREDSLRSDEEVNPSTVQIGSYSDPDIGFSSASLYTQFSVFNNVGGLQFGTAPVVDSVELWLNYELDL